MTRRATGSRITRGGSAEAQTLGGSTVQRQPRNYHDVIVHFASPADHHEPTSSPSLGILTPAKIQAVAALGGSGLGRPASAGCSGGGCRRGLSSGRRAAVPRWGR